MYVWEWGKKDWAPGDELDKHFTLWPSNTGFLIAI